MALTKELKLELRITDVNLLEDGNIVIGISVKDAPVLYWPSGEPITNEAVIATSSS